MPFIACNVVNLSVKSCEGLMPTMMEVMASHLNLSFSYILDNNDPFSMLNDGFGDIVISGYTVKYKRWKTVSFGFPFITKIDYIYSEKKTAKVSESGLYDVFSLNIYLIILLSICLVCVLFIVLVYQDGHKFEYRYTYAVLYVLAAFFQETYPETRLPRGAYFIILQWYLYSMMLTTMYSSVLITQLTYTKPAYPVNTLEDVVNKGLKPLMFEGSSLIDDWRQSDNEIYRVLVNSLETYTNNTRAIKMIKDDFALLAESTVVEYELNQNTNSNSIHIYRSEDSFTAGQYGSWIFGLKNPLADDVSRFLQRCYETGIYTKILRDFTKYELQGKTLTLPQKLDLVHFKVLSLLVASGLTLALALFLLEIIFPPGKLTKIQLSFKNST
ncbi:uncharacterized protein LOC111717896 [Eurytemora carolleeae]|uniref:uncharacterized protein LOC111717896 n=1 Tax=Eurytemora carolleeae TaxID=1294199 RepID=UPI000C75E29A|nr:uncharacterized protein LOC111717896 [Eurytemora carolleeae]|eukprot:XP_023349125.1 uncharacterized protein LOC111717896 [Eurytemora affinis]